MTHTSAVNNALDTCAELAAIEVTNIFVAETLVAKPTADAKATALLKVLASVKVFATDSYAKPAVVSAVK